MATGQVFRPPRREVTIDGRTSPRPGWVSVKWSAKADTPFAELQQEAAARQVFAGFDLKGLWIEKTRKAYKSWYEDCQSPEKLYRACAYFLVTKEACQNFKKEKDYSSMASDLNVGWDILKNPPPSYHFARLGYRFNAGDGDRHLFGDLLERLIARNPSDRGLCAAAVGELWDERPIDGKRAAGKGEAFEKMILQLLQKARSGKQWRPWDDAVLAGYYEALGLRYKSAKHLREAIRYNESAIAKIIPGLDAGYLYKNREQLQRELADLGRL